MVIYSVLIVLDPVQMVESYFSFVGLCDLIDYISYPCRIPAELFDLHFLFGFGAFSRQHSV